MALAANAAMKTVPDFALDTLDIMAANLMRPGRDFDPRPGHEQCGPT